MRHINRAKRTALATAATAAFLVLAGLAPLAAQESEPFIQVIPRAEFGAVAVLKHLYQSGTGNTLFNFVTQGGQDTLFPYERYSADIVLGGRHIVTLLYQPLTLNTRTMVDANPPTIGSLDVGDASFGTGTAVDISYGFDFWRATTFL